MCHTDIITSYTVSFNPQSKKSYGQYFCIPDSFFNLADLNIRTTSDLHPVDKSSKKARSYLFDISYVVFEVFSSFLVFLPGKWHPHPGLNLTKKRKEEQ